MHRLSRIIPVLVSLRKYLYIRVTGPPTYKVAHTYKVRLQPSISSAGLHSCRAAGSSYMYAPSCLSRDCCNHEQNWSIVSYRPTFFYPLTSVGLRKYEVGYHCHDRDGPYIFSIPHSSRILHSRELAPGRACLLTAAFQQGMQDRTGQAPPTQNETLDLSSSQLDPVAP